MLYGRRVKGSRYIRVTESQCLRVLRFWGFSVKILQEYSISAIKDFRVRRLQCGMITKFVGYIVTGLQSLKFSRLQD